MNEILLTAYVVGRRRKRLVLPFCFVHLNDIVIFSQNEAEHKAYFRMLFEILNAYGLTMNALKCLFGVPEISFLVHQSFKFLPSVFAEWD